MAVPPENRYSMGRLLDSRRKRSHAQVSRDGLDRANRSSTDTNRSSHPDEASRFFEREFHKTASDRYASAIHMRGGTDVLQDRCAGRGESIRLHRDKYMVGARGHCRIQLLGGRQQPDPEMPGPEWQRLRYREDGHAAGRPTSGWTTSAQTARRIRRSPRQERWGRWPTREATAFPIAAAAGTATAANANQLSGPFFCQDAGTSSAYSCNLTPAIAAYTAGTTYWFRANTAVTGSATLNLNGLGPKTIVKQSNQSLAANDIRSGQWVMVTYDGTNLQMQSQAGTAVSSVNGRTAR